MAFIHVTFSQLPADCNLDWLVRTIIDSIPGTVCTSENWYEDRRRVLEQSNVESVARGERPPHNDRVIQDIVEAERSDGPAKTLKLEGRDGLELQGRVSCREMLLLSDSPVPDEFATRVRAALESTGLLKTFEVSQISAASPSFVDSEHDESYMAGVRMIWPFIRVLPTARRPLTDDGRQSLENGIKLLERSLTARPESRKNWATHWTLAKGLDVLGRFGESRTHFLIADKLNPSNVENLRGLMITSLKCAQPADAVNYARRAVELIRNAGNLANLALALWCNQEVRRAQQAIQEALVLDPADPISKNLSVEIDRTKRGERHPPSPDDIALIPA